MFTYTEECSGLGLSLAVAYEVVTAKEQGYYAQRRFGT